MKTYILGPCAMDSAALYSEVAEELCRIIPPWPSVDFYYKASFDKANRTSIRGKRGIGLEEAIKVFKEMKKKRPGLKLTTDIHTPEQAIKLAGVVDLAQIPAFLCRQTDLIVECARNFDKVNIKKMQHLGPANLIKSIDKIKNTNPSCEAWLTERGTAFGYDHLIVDFTIVDELKKYYDKVILDCTHATQRSRKVHIVQGDPELAKRYFLTAKIMGYDGVFAETHPRPNESASDGDSMILLSEMAGLIERAEKIDWVGSK